jgi:hypothetical protein
MEDAQINVLISNFRGLGLPKTLCLHLSANATVTDLWDDLKGSLPSTDDRLVLTTTSNKRISQCGVEQLSSLVDVSQDDILPLRLSVSVLGGKGGFGSQLRAAGGRMSSKRKKNQGEQNSSSRNLDGRRLRTVAEAKSLAEYLAIKPQMDQEEKEKRRKRWEEIVELAERKEDEARHGNKARVDGKWMEDKTEAVERTREAVLAAMKAGTYTDNLLGSAGESSSAKDVPMEDESDGEDTESTAPTTPEAKEEQKGPNVQLRTFAGFEEDDEFLSSDEEADDHHEDSKKVTEKSKAKGKAKGKARV